MDNNDPRSDSDWSDELNEQELAAFMQRLALIESLTDEQISEAERGRLRRQYRSEHGVSERTIRNYLRWYREQGPEGLLFLRRSARPRSPRVHNDELAQKLLALIAERPRRSVPQLRRLLSRDPQFSTAINEVSDRSLYRFLTERGLTKKQRQALAGEQTRRSFHQFQAAGSMELVQGDARDGIYLPDPEHPETQQRKTYLFAWVDDYSRKILFAKYYWDEKLPRMEDSFKTMVLRWGIPQKAYLDNGQVYRAAQFAFVLTQLATKRIHHPAFQSWCKGKVEAVMKTLKNEFQAEAQGAGFRTLEELNSALWAWIDVEYNRRNHSSTGEPPDSRFTAGLRADHRRVEDLAWFEALFLLRERRTVTKYGIVKLCSNQYRTRVRYGTVIEVRYNPFDLRTVQRFEDGRPVETLTLHKLINETAPKLAEEQAAAPRKWPVLSIVDTNTLNGFPF